MWGFDDTEAFYGCGPGCLGCDYCRSLNLATAERTREMVRVRQSPGLNGLYEWRHSPPQRVGFLLALEVHAVNPKLVVNQRVHLEQVRIGHFDSVGYWTTLPQDMSLVRRAVYLPEFGATVDYYARHEDVHDPARIRAAWVEKAGVLCR